MTELFQIENVPTADELLGGLPTADDLFPNLMTFDQLFEMVFSDEGRGVKMPDGSNTYSSHALSVS